MSAPALSSRLSEAAAFIRGRSPARPAVGLVLGSGLGGFAQALADRVAIPFEDIPHFQVSTGVVGHAGESVDRRHMAPHGRRQQP